METEDKIKIILEEKIIAKSPDLVYETFIKSFEDVGFSIWKKRPIAWLCMAKKDTSNGEIDANLTLRSTSPVSLTLIMSSTTVNKEELSSLAKKLFDNFYNQLINEK
jgi:hypothetical protein